MSLHLAEVAQAVAPGAHGVMLMDRAGWHRAKDLVVPDNLTLVLLPARAPELNPVENIWQFSARQLVVEPRVRLLRRHRRSLLRRVEPPHRPALDHHVHRPPGLGQCMMISAGWYKILIAAYHMLARGVSYRELGEAYLDQLSQTRTAANLKGRLERLGYHVTLEPKAVAIVT